MSVISFSLFRNVSYFQETTFENESIQHPSHSSMKLSIDTLKIREGDLLFQDHFVEANNEVGIQEPSMENSEAQAASNELEIVKMLRVYPRGWVNLECIVVVGGIFE